MLIETSLDRFKCGAVDPVPGERIQVKTDRQLPRPARQAKSWSDAFVGNPPYRRAIERPVARANSRHQIRYQGVSHAGHAAECIMRSDAQPGLAGRARLVVRQRAIRHRSRANRCILIGASIRLWRLHATTNPIVSGRGTVRFTAVPRSVDGSRERIHRQRAEQPARKSDGALPQVVTGGPCLHDMPPAVLICIGHARASSAVDWQARRCDASLWISSVQATSPRERARETIGGEGGIRTPVPVTRQDAFEAPPLRPLRYLSVIGARGSRPSLSSLHSLARFRSR
jgi:hypothetical protein